MAGYWFRGGVQTGLECTGMMQENFCSVTKVSELTRLSRQFVDSSLLEVEPRHLVHPVIA